MTKKMTDFLSVDNIPDFTTKDLSKLGKDFADYVFGFKTTTKKNLEVQREQLDELNMGHQNDVFDFHVL